MGPKERQCSDLEVKERKKDGKLILNIPSRKRETYGGQRAKTMLGDRRRVNPSERL